MVQSISFLFTFLIAGILQAQAQTPDEQSRLFWEEGIQLKWDDFQAKPQKNGEVAALSSIAIPYGIQLNNDGELHLSLRVCFEKNNSWSKKVYQDERLLSHEQLHFDIAELHRRKLVKRLKDITLQGNDISGSVEEIIQKYWSTEYRKMQDRYDEETNFSKNVDAQVKWEKKIKRLLKKSRRYKTVEFVLQL